MTSPRIECSICLNTTDDFVKIKCGHCFCVGCLEKWTAAQRLTCPLCRAPYEKYGTFDQRLVTFAKWHRHDFASPSEMAANGFIYKSPYDLWKYFDVRAMFRRLPGDCVMCVSCKTFVYGWEPGDVIRDEHRRCAAQQGKFDCKYFK